MKKALIVVDYQKDFVDGALGFLGAEKLDPGIAARIRECRSGGYDIIFTLDTHGDNYLDTAEGRALPVPHCIKGTEGHRLYGLTALELEKGDTVIEKRTFGSDLLMELLREKDYSEIELVGLVSSICVLSNAVIAKAACPEARVLVDSLLTAAPSEQANRNALDALKGIFVEIKE